MTRADNPSLIFRRRARVVALATTLACSFVSAQAALLNWDPDGNPSNGFGGTGTWDTINARFDDDGLAPDLVWNNTAGDTALFTGMAGTVTLGEPITAAGLTFQVGGYTLTGNTLLSVCLPGGREFRDGLRHHALLPP